MTNQTKINTGSQLQSKNSSTPATHLQIHRQKHQNILVTPAQTKVKIRNKNNDSKKVISTNRYHSSSTPQNHISIVSNQISQLKQKKTTKLQPHKYKKAVKSKKLSQKSMGLAHTVTSTNTKYHANNTHTLGYPAIKLQNTTEKNCRNTKLLNSHHYSKSLHRNNFSLDTFSDKDYYITLCCHRKNIPKRISLLIKCIKYILDQPSKDYYSANKLIEASLDPILLSVVSNQKNLSTNLNNLYNLRNLVNQLFEKHPIAKTGHRTVQLRHLDVSLKKLNNLYPAKIDHNLLTNQTTSTTRPQTAKGHKRC